MGKAGNLSISLEARQDLVADPVVTHSSKEREMTVLNLCGHGHGIWSHTPGVFIHLKPIYLSRAGSPRA